MNTNVEVERLTRQNRRLKVALFSTIAAFMIAVTTVCGFTAISANRAKALAQEARAQAQAAREAARAEIQRNEAREQP